MGLYPTPRLLPAGDAAVSVELGDEISREANARALTLERLLLDARLPGLVDTVPTFRSLLVHYDPLVLPWATLRARLLDLAERLADARPPPGRRVELPCAYGGAHGPDLEEVAPPAGAHAGGGRPAPRRRGALRLLRRLHAGSPVHGRSAGARSRFPRLDRPRVKTPPGSVAIGGTQTSIYSVESPGGFWLLGRTPVRLYDPEAARPDPPPRRRPRPLPADRAGGVRGDRRGGRGRRVSPAHRGRGVRRAPSPPRMSDVLTVLDPGLLTTVQDLGRFGHQRVGMPPSGPMDRAAFVVANRLLGNPDAAAALECTIKGPRLEARRAMVVAVTGAPMGFTINGQEAPAWTAVRVRPGDVLAFQMASAGCRAYVAVAGGLDVPRVLGSRATYLRGRLGGLDGRALRKGDALRLLAPAGPAARGSDGPGGRSGPRYPAERECRVILGPQDDRFTAEGLRAFLEAPTRSRRRRTGWGIV